MAPAPEVDDRGCRETAMFGIEQSLQYCSASIIVFH